MRQQVNHMFEYSTRFFLDFFSTCEKVNLSKTLRHSNVFFIAFLYNTGITVHPLNAIPLIHLNALLLTLQVDYFYLIFLMFHLYFHL
jgi:hypothetical protein